MHHTILRSGASLLLSTVALAAQAASLESAAKALGVDKVQTVEFSGAGHWYQFGQAPAPSLAWPPFDVSRYVASIDYANESARVQINRLQTIEPGRNRPAPVEQRQDQYVRGAVAWNLGVLPAPPTFTAQPAAVEERAAEIWSTPQGFIKAAQANGAKSKKVKDGVEISFTLGEKYRYVGTINAQDQLTRVRTWIDSPVLGDTLVETAFTQYRDFEGVPFPSHIVRTQGGHRVLDLAVANVNWNGAVNVLVPEVVAKAPVPPVTVVADKLADGVFYLRGGTHHSVAIEQRQHVVLVEAPLNEQRSKAVIDKVKELIPGKPIKYLINTHAHFDHSGGLRTYVAEGTTIVTHQSNVPYYKAAWAAPHTIKPDLLSQGRVAAKFEAFKDKYVLTDGQRRIEIYPIAGNSHNDAFALVYLPGEKILIEADAYTPLAANAPVPTSVNPYSLNLLDNVEKLKLDVGQIAALHGPGVVKLDDLRTYVGKTVASQ